MRNDKRDLRGKVFLDPRYRRCWPELSSFMGRSRESRNRPGELLDLQAEMLGALKGAQESKRRLERDLAELAVDGTGDVEELEVGVAVARRLARVVKQIADGIAWRALGYDRAVIRQLAGKPQTGDIHSDAAVRELNAAAAHVERTGEVVVVNDLTNFLRYGDYTCVGGGFVTLVECKGGKGARRSGRAKRQRRQLGRVLEFVNAGVRRGADGVEMLVTQRVPARTHLGAVADLIREAKQKGASHAQLSECLAADAYYVDVVLETTERERMGELFHNPFRETREAVSHDSLDFFNEFCPNIAPYSVYPFTDEECTDVMTGAVRLVSYFSYRNLAGCLRRRGLVVVLPGEAEVRDYLSLPIGERRREQRGVAMRVGRPGVPWELLIGGDITARMFGEFLDEESFADGVEDILSRVDVLDWDDWVARDEGSLKLCAGFVNEAELWD